MHHWPSKMKGRYIHLSLSFLNPPSLACRWRHTKSPIVNLLHVHLTNATWIIALYQNFVCNKIRSKSWHSSKNMLWNREITWCKTSLNLNLHQILQMLSMTLIGRWEVAISILRSRKYHTNQSLSNFQYFKVFK